MIETGYKFRNGNILVARYDEGIVLEEGEHWVTSKEDPKHHFVVNKEGQITKGLGGMRPITKEFLKSLPPASVVEWSGGKRVQIGQVPFIYGIHAWDTESPVKFRTGFKIIGDEEIPSMAKVTIPTIKPTLKTKEKGLSNFPQKEAESKAIVQAVCEFSDVEEKEIERRLTKLFENNSMCMAIDVAQLDEAMDSHFANQIELGKSHSVAYNPRARQYLEQEAFGTDLSTEGEYRPKYGYLGPKDFSKDNGRQRSYGTVTVHFKNTGETTFTFGDSMDGFDGHQSLVGAGLVSKPSIAGLPITVGNDFEDEQKNPKEKILKALRLETNPCDVSRKLGIDYIETQYHGKLTAKNVESLCYSEGFLPSKERVEKYRAMGIDIQVRTMDGKVIPYKDGIEKSLLNTQAEWMYVNAQNKSVYYPVPDWDDFTAEQQDRIRRRLRRIQANT